MGLKVEMKKSETVCAVVAMLLLVVILPLLTGEIHGLIEKAFGLALSGMQLELVFSYLLFFICVIGLRGYLKNEMQKLVNRPGRAIGSMVLGYAVYLIAAFLIDSLITADMLGGMTDLNSEINLSLLGSEPAEFIVSAVLLAPLVEETLFRGLVFGRLYEKNVYAAYIISVLFFALIHVAQIAIALGSVRYLIFALAYVPFGIAAAYIYSRSGSLWASILFHMLMNGLSVYSLS